MIFARLSRQEVALLLELREAERSYGRGISIDDAHWDIPQPELLKRVAEWNEALQYRLLYEGQPLLSDIIEYHLSSRGWIYVKKVDNKGAAGEVNAFFVSNEQYRAKVDHLCEILMSNKKGRGAV